MFRNYHVVIYKDREAGIKNLRFRGWVCLVFLGVLFGLAGLNLWLWGFYSKSLELERELDETRQVVRDSENQLLSLTGKLQYLEKDIYRIQQFDSRLRVLLNIDNTSPPEAEEDLPLPESATLSNPVFLSQHRELFSRRLHSLMDELSSSIHLEEIEQQNLISFMRDNKDSLLSMPSIWPAKGHLTSGFGYRSNPFTGRGALHKGLDISNRPGTPIWAPARGTVTFSGPDGAYGISVVIDHGNSIVTRYAHLSKTMVQVGQFVQRGDVIGALGNTGRSTGPHLHYEVIVNGTHVNPMRYIMN